MLTGYVTDFEILLRYRHECELAANDLGIDTPDFYVWMTGHKSHCSSNYSGSASSIEMIAAEKIWMRSESYGLKYTDILCDGDAKTGVHLNSLKPLGPDTEIIKQDCVNHVRKR